MLGVVSLPPPKLNNSYTTAGSGEPLLPVLIPFKEKFCNSQAFHSAIESCVKLACVIVAGVPATCVITPFAYVGWNDCYTGVVLEAVILIILCVTAPKKGLGFNAIPLAKLIL